MKRFFSQSIFAVIIAGMASGYAAADTTDIQWALNAPSISDGGNTQVYWGPLVSQSTLGMSGSANNLYPQLIAGGAISLNGGQAGTVSYCTNTTASLTGPGQPVYPSVTAANYWSCNVQPPPNPKINFADFKALAGLEGSACGGQSCLNPPATTGIVDPVCTWNGLPKVWYFTGSPKFSGSTFFCGVLISEGGVNFSGQGAQTLTVTPGSNAWMQYQVGTPNETNPILAPTNSAGGDGYDPSKSDQFPGDAGHYAVKPITVNGVTFQGYIYATSGYTATGGATVVGAVQFGTGLGSGGGHSTIFFTSSTVFTLPPSNRVNQPIIIPAGGTFANGTSEGVQILETTPGAAVYYTTDGSSPDPGVNTIAKLYSAPFTVTATNARVVVNAIALKTGWNNSLVASATFIFNGSGSGGGSRSPSLIGINIVPGNATVPTGGTQPFSAVGVYSDNSTSPLQVNWTVTGSSNQLAPLTGVSATFTAGGTPGSFTVIAASGTLHQTATILVTGNGGNGGSPTLQSILINPSNAVMQTGGTKLFSAFGVYSDNSTSPLVVSWNATGSANTLSSPSGTSTNFMAGGTTGSFTVSAASGTIRQTATVIVTSAGSGGPGGGVTLVNINVIPNFATVLTGGTQVFSAVGNYSDGSNGPLSVDWSATGSDNSLSSTSSESTTFTAGPSAGTFTVSATSGAIRQDATIIVNLPGTTGPGSGGGGSAGPTLTGILVSPSSAATGFNGQVSFNVLGSFSDGSTSPLAVLWAVTGSGNIVNPPSDSSSTLFTAANVPGTFTVTATSGSIQGTATVEVEGGSVTGGLWIIDPASATPNPVHGKSTSLHVLAQSTNSGPITYTWTYSGLAPQIISVHSSDSAVNFSQPGIYALQVLITDSAGLHLTSAVSVNVIQTVTRVVVTPSQATTFVGQSFPFNAQALDQWGNPMNVTLRWDSTSGAQTISQTGSFLSSVPLQNVTVKATADNGVYGSALMNVQLSGAGAGSSDISNAKAYPVPYKSTSGDPGITFTGLAPATTIKIYTTDGHLVDSLTSTDGENVLWPVTNANGHKVASWVYFYHIDNSSSNQHKEGKLVVIQ